MKVGIDAFGCDHARSGLGSYLLYFISNLPENSDFPELEVELFGPESDRFTYSSEKDINYNSVRVPDTLQAERIWHLLKNPGFVKKNCYDAVIYPACANVIPVNFNKKIVSIAVMNSIYSSVFASSDLSYRWQLKKGLKKAKVIVAATNFIKDDLIKNGFDEKKIKVIYNGIDHKLFYPGRNTHGFSEDSDVVEISPFAIKRPYFIYGSRLSGPEKKHVELIKAFDLFKKRTGLPHRLVIAGSDGPYSDIVHKTAFESEYATDLFLTGYFPHESFPQLYSGAEACIFPSVDEGVGLPVLEAMASGIPVLCSSSGALKEVCDDVPLYFDSENITQIASLMEKIVTDENLRSECVQKGLKRAVNFSWKKTVLETLNCIKNKNQ